MKTYKIETLKKEYLHTLASLAKTSLIDHWTYKQFEIELSNPLCVCFVALEENTPVGFLVLHMGEYGVIQLLAVESDYRRKGIGSALLQKAIDKAKEEKCKGVTLDVRSSNHKAIVFYKAKGFHLMHRAKNQYQNPTNDAWILGIEF